MCALVIRSTRHGITNLVTGGSIAYFRFGSVSGTQHTAIASVPKEAGVTDCNTSEKNDHLKLPKF